MAAIKHQTIGKYHLATGVLVATAPAGERAPAATIQTPIRTAPAPGDPPALAAHGPRRPLQKQPS